MKVIIVTDASQDYMADYLFDGFASLTSPTDTLDWPPKPSLHHGERRTMDCDFNWPFHQVSEGELLAAMRDKQVDLVVVPTLRGRVPALLTSWRPFLPGLADRTVYIDGEDHPHDTLSQFEDAAGVKPAVYFKRELPLTATWAKPLTFAYPARRIVAPGGTRSGVFYDVQIWPWAVGGPRERLGHLLRKEFGRGATVAMPYDGTTRHHPDDYHARARRTLVAVAPAGAGYFTNRLFEVVADGCALVAERPYAEFPDAFEAAHYYSTPEEAVGVVADYLAEPEVAQADARAVQCELRAHHTTEVRARQVYEAVHGPTAFTTPGEGAALTHGMGR